MTWIQALLYSNQVVPSFNTSIPLDLRPSKCIYVQLQVHNSNVNNLENITLIQQTIVWNRSNRVYISSRNVLVGKVSDQQLLDFKHF